MNTVKVNGMEIEEVVVSEMEQKERLRAYVKSMKAKEEAKKDEEAHQKN